MKKILPLLFFVIFLASIKHVYAGQYNETLGLTEIIDDGISRYTIGVGYTNVTATVLQMGQNVVGTTIDRGWVVWNITGLPSGIIITNAYFQYDGFANNADGTIRGISINADIRPANEVYWAIGNGTAYGGGAASGFPVVGNNQELELNAATVTALQNALNSGTQYFTIGFQGTNEGGANTLSSIESSDAAAPTPAPSLVIEYNYPYQYIFSDTYYENGTLRVPPVNVTVTGPGFTDTFNTSGGYSYGNTIEPTLFQWSITDGSDTATRRIYSIGSENITTTYPESDFETYVFTVRDFTGRLSRGDGYLEAWRIINSTDTLVERQIIDIHNEVPLNLVVGATYTIRVRFYDNTSITWGTYVPGDSTIFTIVLRGVEFSDQAYQVSNFITIDVQRSTDGTTFTVDYEASQNNTIWANITIQVRNGAIVNQVSRTNNSFVYNFGGALANTSYVVLINGEHTLLTQWGFTRIFDASETYPDVPNLEAIFPMGVLNAANLIGWVLSIGAGGLTYSVNMKRASLFSTAAMASFLKLFGFTDWSYFLLAIVWFFAVIVFIGGAERT